MILVAGKIGGTNKRKKYASIRARDGDVCWCCGEPIDFDLPREHLEAGTLDHVIPVCAGGTNANDNLRLAHRICNELRGRRQQEDAEAA